MLALALVFFYLNLFLFVLFTALTIPRYSIFRQSWRLMLRPPFFRIKHFDRRGY